MIECQEECRELKIELQRLKGIGMDVAMKATSSNCTTRALHPFSSMRKKRFFSFCFHFVGVLLIFMLEDVLFPRQKNTGLF